MSAAASRSGTAFLNGNEVAIEPGETILDAARRLRIEIPTLCHHERLDPVGGCRLCLVHCEGRDRPVAACHTPLEPGMKIQTHHAEVEALRRTLLELYFETGPQTGFDPRAAGDGPFADLVDRYEPEVAVPAGKLPEVSRDRSHPFLEYTAGACIDCRLCLEGCAGWQNEFVFALDGRGGNSHVRVVGGTRFDDSPCVACGACVDLCPTGALSDRDRRRPLVGKAEVRMTDTVCGFCSVGCGIEVVAAEGVIRRVAGIPGATVNRGHLCQKGRYGHDSAGDWERITKPMLRDGAGFREVGWDEAIAFISEKISGITRERGPDAFGAIASPQATNEANYLLQKFCRTIIGTNNIDSTARFSHLTSAWAMHAANGYGAGMVSFDAIEKAHCFVVAGADLTVSHPVLGARVRRAVAKGAKLIVIDPRLTELAHGADLFIQPRPGTDATLFNGLARELLEKRLVNSATLATHAIGVTQLRGILNRYPLKKVAEHCDLGAETLSVLAESLAEFGERALFLYGTGLTQQGNGAEAVGGFYNLAVLCGAVGHGQGGGVATPGGQGNLQGTIDAGCLPEWLAGHRPVDAPAVWPHFRAQWGVDPPEKPGLNCRQMLEAAANGKLSALWVTGRDLMENLPDQAAAEEALKALDLLVVQELSYSGQCRHAHVILPAATFYEQDGTFTNGERRVQLIRQAVDPPDEVRPGWFAIVEVARRLGTGWQYQDAAQIFDEIARVVPDLMGGLSHDRLEDEPGGLQWPCPHRGHPGTADLRFEDLPEGRTRVFADFTTPYPELGNGKFPCLLFTGRQLEHSGAGSLSRPNPPRNPVESDYVEVHPADAKRLGIAAGMKVTVESASGKIETVACLSGAIRAGTVFLTGSSPRAHASRLAGSRVDPASGCPAFNGIPVRLAPASK